LQLVTTLEGEEAITKIKQEERGGLTSLMSDEYLK
jgi:hypothetical protein